MQSFIQSVGVTLNEAPELLAVVSEIKPKKETYKTWKNTIGVFLEVMGTERFFKTLPLQILTCDMNSLTYAHDSRSYLI